jgi:hypothetical protein
MASAGTLPGLSAAFHHPNQLEKSRQRHVDVISEVSAATGQGGVSERARSNYLN